jgi:hypothetical protein
MALTRQLYPPATNQLFFEGNSRTISWTTMRARGPRRREHSAHALPQTPAEFDALVGKGTEPPDTWLQRRARATSAAAWAAEDLEGSYRTDGGARLWEASDDGGDGGDAEREGERGAAVRGAPRASQRRPRTAIVVSSLACDDDIPFRPFTADQRRQRQALQRSLRAHSSPGFARRSAPLSQPNSRSRLLSGSRTGARGTRASCAKLELVQAWGTARPSPSTEHAMMRQLARRSHPSLATRGHSRGGYRDREERI